MTDAESFGVKRLVEAFSSLRHKSAIALPTGPGEHGEPGNRIEKGIKQF